MRLVRWADRIIAASFFLLFGLVPLLLTPINYELFEYNKMMAVYGLTVIIAGSWLIKSFAQKEFRFAKTPLDIPLALFVGSQLVSSLLSIDPHVSWFGYYSRFNGGLWSVICYALLYYAFLTNLDAFSNNTAQSRESGIMNHESRKKSKKNNNEPVFSIIHNSLFTILRVALTTAALVALYGVLERLGIDKHLWVQDVQNRVFSTLGRPNWLGAYLTALVPLTWYFALKSQITNHKQNVLNFGNRNLNIVWNLEFGIWCLLSVLFFLVLLFTRSRSGLLAFIVADLVFWSLLWIKQQNKKSLRLPLIVYHVLFLAIVFFNGTNIPSLDRFITFGGWKDRILPKPAAPAPVESAGPALESGGTESGTIRKYVWQAAVTAWKSSTKTFLVGTGTETFAFAFFRYRPAGHNMTSEWDFLYNKAHNEYLNYLSTTGLFGLASYLLLIGAFIVWFIKLSISNFKFQIGKDGQKNESASFLSLTLFSGWSSILVTNFFGFSVVMTQIFFFLFPAMIVATIENREPRTFRVKFPPSAIFLVFLALLVSLALLFRMWYADTRFAAGYRANRAGRFSIALPLLERATTLNRAEPLYWDELSSAYAGLAVAAIEGADATAAAEFARQSLAASDRALMTSPENVNFWKTRTKIFYAFSSYDPEFTRAAIASLSRSRELSPNDPKILYNLAILYGKTGDSTKAIELLLSAIDLKANYRDAYWAGYIFYTEAKKPAEAAAILQTYLSAVDPNDQEFQARATSN